MSWSFFWIPAECAKSAQDELDKQFVADGANSARTIAVEVLGAPAPAVIHNAKIDYREVLDSETLNVFASLRTLREQLAEGEGVPAYAIVTNEQLAELARVRPSTRDALKDIAGFGEARIRRYGQALIEGPTAAPPEPRDLS